MASIRLISLHPKLAAVFDLIFSLFLIWWISAVTNPNLLLAWFLVRIVWWAVLSQVAYYPPFLKRYRHLISLVIFNVGITSFLVFSDPGNIIISRVLMLALPFFSFWLIPERADSLSVMEKPHRRWNFFMSLFGVAGVWLAALAGIIFQIISKGWWILGVLILAALATAAISFWEWNEYGLPASRELFRMLFAIFLLMLELGAVIFLWPIGYFVGSFFITWVWYLCWLFFRFYLSGGINWPKQRVFLVGNLVLMILFLYYVVRWT